MSDPALRGDATVHTAFRKTFASLWVIARAWRSYRDLALLESAGDRALSDVGLTRGDVRGALAGPWWSRGTRDLITATTSRRATAIHVAGRR